MTKKELIEKVKEGDVILSMNVENPHSDMIAGITGSNYSHAMYVVNKGTVIESVPPKTKITDLSHYVNGPYNLAVFRAIDLSAQDNRKKTKFIYGQVGERYSYFQLATDWFRFKCGLRSPKDTDLKATVCSELIALADERLFRKLVIPDVRYWNVAPGDFAMTPRYALVGEAKA